MVTLRDDVCKSVALGVVDKSNYCCSKNRVRPVAKSGNQPFIVDGSGLCLRKSIRVIENLEASVRLPNKPTKR
jgi:hypothetical protein